jgi:CBS domain-containing protein
MSIAGIYVRDVETVGPEETATGLARRMRDRGLGTLVVVDEERRPMGIVSDRDVAVRVVAGGDDPSKTPVRDIMTPMPTTVLRDTSIEAALGEMRVGRIRRLPVVDGMGKLVGILTLDDMLRFLAQEFGEVGLLIQEESPLQAS